MSLLHRVGKKTNAATLGLAGTAAVSAVALAAPSAAAASPENATADVRPVAVRAMAQDLGIDRGEAMERLRSRQAKANLADRLDAKLGSSAAGAFIDPQTGQLVVNVTGAQAAGRVRATDARPRVVERSMNRLQRVQAQLQPSAADGTTLAIDVRDNVVEVTVPEGRAANRTQAFVQRARSFGDAVQIDRVAGAPRTAALYGGEAIVGGGSRCSAGFVAGDYVITAGHCTSAISSWSSNDGYVGPSVDASFPGNDYGLIRIDGSVNPVGAVLDGGGTTNITGAGTPPVGTYLCKTGSTTGTTCGTILDYNVTVNYPSGTVSGLIKTDICTQGGDSGGALFSGSTAVGITSGGTTVSCGSSSFRAYFQPVGEALSTYGLSLS